jgi:hypothetical protein
MTPYRAVPAAAFAFLLSLSTLRAQPSTVPQTGFGGDLQVLTLSHYAFVPHNSDTTYFSVCCFGDAYASRPAAERTSTAPTLL